MTNRLVAMIGVQTFPSESVPLPLIRKLEVSCVEKSAVNVPPNAVALPSSRAVE
jgi:hypothetical protein